MVNKKTGLGILVMALVFGMMLVGCDDGSKEDSPCCTKDTWQAISGSSGMPSEADINKLPSCCKTSFNKFIALMMTGSDPTESQIKEAVGCCYDSMKAAGAFDD